MSRDIEVRVLPAATRSSTPTKFFVHLVNTRAHQYTEHLTRPVTHHTPHTNTRSAQPVCLVSKCVLAPISVCRQNPPRPVPPSVYPHRCPHCTCSRVPTPTHTRAPPPTVVSDRPREPRLDDCLIQKRPTLLPIAAVLQSQVAAASHPHRARSCPRISSPPQPTEPQPYQRPPRKSPHPPHAPPK